MSKSDFEPIREPSRIWATFLCPDCSYKYPPDHKPQVATFYHDTRYCKICNYIDVIYCPKCQTHFKIKPPSHGEIYEYVV